MMEKKELVFEKLEVMEAPGNMDPYVAGWIVGGGFVSGLGIGAGIAILT
ncbi:hypothetical protein JDS97_26990 [Bacillus cereus group sp. N18]|nr:MULTISPECIES: hypothetical protein [Bacillus cereus group]MBJ8049882.1 hypothetical protein [Bacillus cereus group sp. N18]OFC94531.1 hypothetical protein BTGOE5_51900 [Bacillus thuringiensis]OFD02092.1 hypothetical protein BTGOE7_53640 [Bacillus thuringiensis]